VAPVLAAQQAQLSTTLDVGRHIGPEIAKAAEVLSPHLESIAAMNMSRFVLRDVARALAVGLPQALPGADLQALLGIGEIIAPTVADVLSNMPPFSGAIDDWLVHCSSALETGVLGDAVAIDALDEAANLSGEVEPRPLPGSVFTLEAFLIGQVLGSIWESQLDPEQQLILTVAVILICRMDVAIRARRTQD
jgi:hypothetical protein